MTKKINSFVLTDDIIERMGYHLERTRSTGLEHGFILCSKRTPDGEVLTDRGHCSGTKCDLRFEYVLTARDERVVGSYHTHPNSESIMSDADMKISCDHEIACVGGDKDNRIRCFVAKKNIDRKACKAQADISIRKNMSFTDESKRIALEKEAFSKIADDHNRKIIASKRYSKEMAEENKRLSKRQEELNDRIARNNKNVEEHMRLKNEIISKYFDIYDIK